MNFSEQQKSQLLIITIAGLVLLAIIAYYHIMFGRVKIRDYNKTAANLQTQIKEKNTELEDIRTLIAQKSKLEERRKMISKVIRRLPSTPDAPGFLAALVTILRQTGIIQRVVKPEKPINRNDYTEIPYSISSFGRYHELGQFLTLVEQNSARFMRVKNIKVENNLSRPSIHPIDVQISTFMFNK